MKKIFLFYFSFILSSCSFYYGHIADGTTNKIKLIEEISKNPFYTDSLIENSEFYDSSIVKYIFHRKGEQNIFEHSFIENKGKKLYIYKENKLVFGDFDYNRNPKNQEILNHILCFSFEDSDYVFIVIFKYINNKWIITNITNSNKNDDGPRSIYLK